MGDRSMNSLKSSVVVGLVLLITIPTLATAQGIGGDRSKTPLRRIFNRNQTEQPQPPQPTQPKGTDAVSSAAIQLRSGEALPAPVDPGVETASLHLPTAPLEPYLLNPKAGPFMVMARVFRGEHAVRQAQALAMELRHSFGLPAYVYFLKIKPANSNIRGVAPTSVRGSGPPELTIEEQLRLTDEAAVLVGDCVTVDQADDLLNQVRKIRPKTLVGQKSIFPWRDETSLARAFHTTNPLAASQDIYPGLPGHHHHDGPPLPPGAVVTDEVLRSSFVQRSDPVVVKWNQGTRHSIYNNPAPYTLVVAEFRGRAYLNPQEDEKEGGVVGRIKKLVDSPLRTAADDAELVASQLAENSTLRSMGVRPYVYHDRRSSRVMIGEFSAPNDPKVDQVRRAALSIAVERKHEGKKVQQSLTPAQFAFEVPRP